MKKIAVLNCYRDFDSFVDDLEIVHEQLGEWVFVFVTGTAADLLNHSVQAIFLKEKIGFEPPFMPLKSYCIFQVLREKTPDLIVFQGSPALAFFSLLDRKQNDLLHETVFLLLRPSTLAFEAEQGERFLAGRTDIELNAMEEYSVGLFDKLVPIGSEDFLGWAEKACWSFPEVVGLGHEKIDISTLHELGIHNKKQAVDAPFISVCLTTFNRPELLSEALESLVHQSFTNFEVIVVDDGSALLHRVKIEALEKYYASKEWKFFFQKNSGPSAARNLAASKAAGTHLLFMDDDDIALADELQVFARAVQNSDADIFTCIPGLHPETIAKSELNMRVKTNDPQYPEIEPDFLPLGGFLDLSVFINCFGCNNALIRKSVFQELGGYAAEKELLLEDVELFTRIVVENYKLEVIPHVLFLYRKHANSRSWNEHTYLSHVRSLEPYKKLIDQRLWPLIESHRKGFYDRHVAITSSVREKFHVFAGEWILYSEDEISILVDNPGKKHALLVEAKGIGTLHFEISNQEYSFDMNIETPSFFEYPLLPGAIQSSGEISIKFNVSDNILLKRFSFMRLMP